MGTTTSVHARIDERVKSEAADALAAMGLTIPEAIRIMLTRVATEHRLPFDTGAARTPNEETRLAIQELETGKGRRNPSLDALFTELNADD